MRDQLLTLPGFTHVEIVKSLRLETMPVGNVTYCVVPLRLSELLNSPVVHVGVFTSVAFLPLPDESDAVVPLVSLSFNHTARFESGAGFTPMVICAVALPPPLVSVICSI